MSKVIKRIEHLDSTVTLPRTRTGVMKFDPDYDMESDKNYFSQALILNLSYFQNICQHMSKIFNLNMEDDLERFSDVIHNFQEPL
jgi:hypothetical protein